ncbi:MAG: FtsH protease activity modulator HflK [Pseudomonadales bacterium]|nr:FtsH protease activity modulator HflK [Pseudomonadales bacterium]
MAWNEPGDDDKKKDPWSNNGNRNGNQGPPDLDEALDKLKESFAGLFGGKKNSGGGSTGGASTGGSNGLFGAVAAIALVVVLGFNSVYTVNEQERGIILRFGEYHATVTPGLQFKIPLIDKVLIANVTRVRDSRHTETMLTEDENIIDVSLTIQYIVADPRSYLLRVKNPEQVLANAVESALRHVVGTSIMDAVITEGRTAVAVEVRAKLQQSLDNYQTGLQVSNVNIEEAKPPREVQAAFDDVIKAKEDKTRYINQSETYANGILPIARGQAQRQIEEAIGYQKQVVAKAKGEADRFEKLLAAYKTAPEVTRERLYIDSMQSVLSNSSKIMMDVEGSGNMIYLPLDKLMSERTSAAAGSGGSVLTDEQIRDISNRVESQIRSRQTSTRTRRELR